MELNNSRPYTQLSRGGKTVKIFNSYHIRSFLAREGATYDGVLRCWVIPLNHITAKRLLTLSDVLLFDEETLSICNRLSEFDPFCKIECAIRYIPAIPDMSHQVAAKKHIDGLVASGLFMEMGCGKTKTALEIAIERHRNGYFDTIAICTRVGLQKSSLADDIMKFVDDDYELFHLLSNSQTHCLRYRRDESKKLRILTFGYSSIQNEVGWQASFINKYLGEEPFALICDEAHYIKNSTSATYKSLHKIRYKENCKTMIALTGTPMTNTILDYYGVLSMINKDALPVTSKTGFLARYTEQTSDKRQIIGLRNEEELFGIVNKMCFICKKDDVLDIPPKTYIVRKIELGSEQKRLIREAKSRINTKTDNLGEVSIRDALNNALSIFTYCVRVSSGIVKDDETGAFKLIDTTKISELIETLKDIPSNDQVVVWAASIEELKIIKTYLFNNDYTYAEYHGGLSQKDKLDNLNKFIDGSKWIFLATPQCGGEGLNLTNARYVIYYSNSLRLGDRLQSEDRCHRKGQAGNVTYIDLICGPIESKIFSMNKEKRDFATFISDSITKNGISDEFLGIFND